MSRWREIFRLGADAWADLSQPWRYALIAATSLVASVGGIIYAAYKHNCQVGGRGGAVATMAAIFIVLLRPDYGQRSFDDRIANLDKRTPRLEIMEEKVAALVAAMHINSQGQSRLNIGLVIASGIGTIAWGFGDVAARFLVDHHFF